MRNNQQLGVAVSGLGVGERHARMISTMSEVKLLKLYDPDQEKADLLSAELLVEKAESFNDFLQDERIDIVIIASPDHFHAEQVIAAINSNKHVFAEKPLCNTIDELRNIIDVWRSHSGKLQLHSNLILRAAPLYQWLKKQIEEGLLGDIYAFDGDYLYGRLEKILNGWRGTGENYSGMKGGGVHLIDLMCWLTGQRPISVLTMGNAICTSNSSITIDDQMSAMFRFDSGLIGRITANLGCVHRHQHVLRIFGTKATFIYDDSGARIHLSRDPALRATPVELNPLPVDKSDLLPAFFNALRGNLDTLKQTEESFAIVSACFASDKSLSSGKEEPIKYI